MGFWKHMLVWIPTYQFMFDEKTFILAYDWFQISEHLVSI